MFGDNLLISHHFLTLACSDAEDAITFMSSAKSLKFCLSEEYGISFMKIKNNIGPNEFC